MTIAQLSFDLDRPEDAERYRLVNEAEDWLFAIQEYDNWLRNAIKHGQGKDECGDIINAGNARSKLYDLLQERHLVLHDRG